ncbi:hypothetical protein C5U48_12935 [Mycolicibacter virginiensis]|uniref:Head-tail adaptor protein n=1 Tax=Mycolicibacter virginiensis TaxID=1795032 RepID=A0A9X7IMS0_9MYCO|nr:hypothetical protein [Mycolicibacter virginiensis]PQM51824.1 hypothetical protein C5U48_12935 [Mycolicibacter virginiensis]
MSEEVLRHRGGGRDEDGKLVTAGTPVPLQAIGIAPGGGGRTVERLRDGQTVVHTVYLPMGTDLVNTDELTVRGERFRIIVNDWRMRGRGGLEVLCTRGQG